MDSKDLEGKGRGVIKITSRHLTAVTEKDHTHQVVDIRPLVRYSRLAG